ncbi:PKD domain-containing protein [Oopsacas minuta]|uniref:PKD domain-containing protein n=1 Tax=Oopsacas minuta TaxID=111878 RepID=A0AAV7JQ38_9METZ|nr:PKD domain-containing protein [Oopsacas minuta]
MATAGVDFDFPNQIQETRKKIQNSFKRSYQALQNRESYLLCRVDEIEKEYKRKTEEMQELLETLNKNKLFSADTLTSNILADTHRGVEALINNKIQELSVDTGRSIEFEWDNLFEAGIERLGSIKLNSQSNQSPSPTLSPKRNPIAIDYKTKQLPTAYCCKRSTDTKLPGEMNNTRGIGITKGTGSIYIVDMNNHRVQVFSSNGDYLFMFSEKMTYPLGICVTETNVFVTQHGSNCINKYKLDGKLIKSVGSYGKAEAQFICPYGVAESYKTKNVYVCDSENKRVQIFTKDLEFQATLCGKNVFKYPVDIKVKLGRVFVLDSNDPCMLVFNTNHEFINRLITRGTGKQTSKSLSFDIDNNFNIIMSDFNNDCVYVFSQEGEQIHKFGKTGRDIGEFMKPWGILLDNTGRIIVVCQKDTNCVQFF